MGWMWRHAERRTEKPEEEKEGLRGEEESGGKRKQQRRKREGTLLFPNSFEFSISRGEGWVGGGQWPVRVIGWPPRTCHRRVAEDEAPVWRGVVDEGMCGAGEGLGRKAS